jgi:FtsH-binding integral membrane protein
MLVGFVASTYDPESVFLAVALTAGIVILLTLFAFQPWVDATKWGPALFLVFIVYFVANIGVSLAYGFSDNSSRFYLACVGAAIFSLYIIYDTQMMMGELRVIIVTRQDE